MTIPSASDAGSNPSDGLADDLDLALHVVDVAGRLALEHFHRGVTMRTKADGTSVTDADLAVERAMRAELGAARPADGVFGEELGRSAGNERTWIIDPIDGTSLFAAGNPSWRVQIALQIAGETVLGVVAAPAADVRWWATKGGGAYEAVGAAEPQRLHVSLTDEPNRARIAVWPSTAEPLLPPGCTPASASGLHLADLLRGALDGYIVACCHAWDHAPWILLVEESGGRFTDWTGGHSAERGGGIYSNAALHPLLSTIVPRAGHAVLERTVALDPPAT